MPESIDAYIAHGNAPYYSDFENYYNVYKYKESIGIIKQGALSTGKCKIGNIEFLISKTGFYAEFFNENTHKIRTMRLGDSACNGESARVLQANDEDYNRLTINHIFATLMNSEHDSILINKFAIRICDIMYKNFKLSPSQLKLRYLIIDRLSEINAQILMDMNKYA